MPIPSPPLFGPFDRHRDRRSFRGTTLRLQPCSPLDAVFAHRGRSLSGSIGCETLFCLREGNAHRAVIQAWAKSKARISVFALFCLRARVHPCRKSFLSDAALAAEESFSSPAATISAGPTPVPDANRRSAYFDFGCCCCCNCCNCWKICCGVSTPRRLKSKSQH